MNEESSIISHERKSSGENKNMFVFLGVILSLALAFGSFVSGFQMGTPDNRNSTGLEAGLFSLFSNKGHSSVVNEEINLDEFWKVWKLLDEKFVSASTTFKVTTEQKLQGAIRGLVDSYGDPYTVFLPPSDAEKFEEEISGNFSGVGMEVGIKEGTLTVIAPLPDTPAKKAGILAGDIIIEIDNTSTKNMSISDAVSRIRGEEGTTVTLLIFREGESELLTIPIVRGNIAIPTVDTEIMDGVFIIRLYSFNALSEIKMQEALRKYVQSGSDKIILDMRGNPGGFLQSAISIASYFLPAGKVVVREDFGNGREEIYRSQGRTLKHRAPEKMVVLIDGGSASASEILAGALKEHGVATLIGETTFGKGSVQELVDLPRGSSLKVTIARWLTPDGTSISEGGLKPNIEVKVTAEQRKNNEDPQMDEAIKYITDK